MIAMVVDEPDACGSPRRLSVVAYGVGFLLGSIVVIGGVPPTAAIAVAQDAEGREGANPALQEMGGGSSPDPKEGTSRAARVAATTSTTVLGLGLTYGASIAAMSAVANTREQCLDHDPNFCGDRHAGGITGVVLGPFLIGMGVDLVGDRLDGRGG